MVRRFTFDLVSEVFCGGSISLQQKAFRRHSKEDVKDVEEMEYAFDNANRIAAIRLVTGPLHWLVEPKVYAAASATFKRYADRVLDLANKRRVGGDETPWHPDESGQEYSFIRELVDSVEDQVLVRDLVVQMVFAGIDTTTSLLTLALLCIAGEPGAWQRLRDDLDKEGLLQAGPACFTRLRLKDCHYLQNVISETLRLYPAIPVNSRDALRDTILPVGGGKDGKSPLFVPKGTQVRYSAFVMQRREDIWGPDASEWKPDRWIGRRQGWEYIPFSGGPRVCLGRTFLRVPFLPFLFPSLSSLDSFTGLERCM